MFAYVGEAVLVYFFVCHSAFSDFLGCEKQILILDLFLIAISIHFQQVSKNISIK